MFALTLIIGSTGLFFFTLSSVAVFFLSGERRAHREHQRNLRMSRQFDSNFRISVVGYKLPGGEVRSSPGSAEVIRKNGAIIIIGQPSCIETLRHPALGKQLQTQPQPA